MTARTEDFYAIPMLYDVLHWPGTADEVRALQRIAEDHTQGPARPGRGPEPHTWLEPACGTGRYIRVAASLGVRAIGIDNSPQMIDYARRRIATRRYRHLAEFFLADMTSFTTHTGPHVADFAFNTINSIRHLYSDRDMLDHFQQVREALRPGGVYAVGISLSAYGVEAPSEDTWTGARGRLHVTQVVQYEPPASPPASSPADRLEHVYSHLTVERPTGTEHIDSTYALRTYDTQQWDTLLRRAGFVRTAAVDEEGRPAEVTEPGYAIHILGPD